MDRTEFDAQLLAHLDAAARFAVRLTGRVDSAEDVTHEAIVRATSAWRTFSGRSSFKTWFFQIVLNAFRDAQRLIERRPTMRLVDEPPITADPSIAAGERELGARIAQLVSQLPPRQREVLVLVAYEQFPQEQAAEILGITPQNLRTTLHLARQRMREQLSEFTSRSERI